MGTCTVKNCSSGTLETAEHKKGKKPTAIVSANSMASSAHKPMGTYFKELVEDAEEVLA
jgi:hypothetical protein